MCQLPSPAQSFAKSAPDMTRVQKTKVLLLVVVVLPLCAANTFSALDGNLNAMMDQIPKVNRSIAQVRDAGPSAPFGRQNPKAELFLFFRTVN